MSATQIIELLINDIYLALELFVLATTRPFGLTLFFSIFAWAHLNVGVIRMVFATAVGIPVFSAYFQMLGGQHPTLPYPLPIVLLKELCIGALLGWTLSLPFSIFASGGHIIDSYRGASTGDTDPAGGQITPVAKLFSVVALLAFAYLDGFWRLSDIFYTTYSIWPIFDAAPFSDQFSIESVITFLHSLTKAALVFSAPILTIMFVSDIVFLFTTKFGKQINVAHLAFSVKNVIMLMLLPYFILVAIEMMADNILDQDSALTQLQAIWP